MNLSKFTKTTWAGLKKHSPAILTAIGIAGLVSATVMAVNATPKAIKLIEEAGYKKAADENPCMDMEYTPLTALETVKVAWKPYLPVAITTVTSIACIVGASKVSSRRNAALATAYTVSETALREYKDKVKEIVGDKKEKEVRDAIAKDKIEKNPVSRNEVIITEHGDSLCYDPFTSRYFKSDMHKLKSAINVVNHQMLQEGWVTLNDLYYELGLEEARAVDDIGWRAEDGIFELSPSSQIASDGTPCLVLDFSITPKYDIYKNP